MADTGGIAGERLRSLIERIERLEEEKAAIANDIKEIYAEAKSAGFDTKTMRQVIRLRKMSADERAEHEALLDIYKAALGMLADTPLGAAAIRHITKKSPPPQAAAEEPEPPAPEPEPTGPVDSIDDARRKGREAAQAGEPVTTNPYPARDPRRAAWDEAWCMAAGSDGMEIPDWLQRQKPSKPKADDDNKKAA